MPNKNKFRGKNKKNQKKAQKKQIQDEDELSAGSLDDEALFFNEEFVPPEGEDLDEPEDEELQRIIEAEKREQELEEEGEFEGEGFDDEEVDGEEEEPADRENIIEIRKIPINEERLSRVIEQTDAYSRKALRLFLRIFKSAINQGTEDDDQQIVHGKNPVEYEVEDGNAYNQVITYALSRLPHVLQHHLKNGGLTPEGKPSRNMQIVLNSYFANFVKLLVKTHDKNIVIYMLTNAILSIKMLFFVKVYLLKYLKHLIELWSTHESNVVKFKAFLNIRAICAEYKDHTIEKIFRRVYLAFVKNAKFVTWMNYEQIKFMINCYIELLGLNKEAAYVVGFSYLREIAVHLKNCMKERTKENIFKIYNWQFLNCIRLWFAAVGAYSSQDDLGRLAHPLIEITHGILKFYPNVRYAPLRIHLIEYLNEFNYKSSVYIPVVGYLFEILKEINFDKKRDRTITKKFDFTINVKTQKEFMKAEEYYKQLFQLVSDKLLEAFSNFALYLAYPESLTISRLFIKKYLKNMRNKEMRETLKTLLTTLDQNEKKFVTARKEVAFSNKPSEVNPLTRANFGKAMKGLSLFKLNHKLKKQNEEYIKQNILAEQERFYSEAKEEGEEEDNGEDIEEEGIEDGEEDGIEEEDGYEDGEVDGIEAEEDYE